MKDQKNKTNYSNQSYDYLLEEFGEAKIQERYYAIVYMAKSFLEARFKKFVNIDEFFFITFTKTLLYQLICCEILQ